MSEIAKLEALEILDSRGNPTLSVTATLANGVKATAKCLQVHRPESGKLSNSATAIRRGTEARAC